MSIRGWIYVLSNQAMPGLVKVGFSTKDPLLRVGELSGTGLPHSFEIEYDALVIGPRDVEQKVHKRLAAQKEAKEFFRCSPGEAISAIREVLSEENKQVISEQFGVNSNVEKQSSSGRYAVEKCAVCSAWVKRSDNRCQKCFALLP